MEQQERLCFLERARLPSEQLHSVNVARGDQPTLALVQEVDALFVGGAGKYSAAQTYSWTEPIQALVRYAVDQRLPTLGSCWGHQVIARALGGRVVHDPKRAELGCGWVELTESGTEDPLFHRFPHRFRANMGHHDRVVELPPGAVELAHNDQPFQAFRINDAPVYGTQFHSELDAERERERILVYRKHYPEALPDEKAIARVLKTLAETTAVDTLLYDFLTTFVARPSPSVSATTLLPSDAPEASPSPRPPWP